MVCHVFLNPRFDFFVHRKQKSREGCGEGSDETKLNLNVFDNCFKTCDCDVAERPEEQILALYHALDFSGTSVMA